MTAILRWSGPIAFETKDTRDRRRILHGAITWPDRPLWLLKVPDEDGDIAPERVGTIETVERRDGAQYGASAVIYATGTYTGGEYKPGDKVGIAVDVETRPGDVEVLDDKLCVKAGRLRAAQIGTTPAWHEAVVTIDA